MSKFEIIEIVKASLYAVRDHRKGLFKAALWPAAGAVVGIGIYFLQIFQLGQAGQNPENIQSTGEFFAVMGPMFLSMVPLLLVFIAFSLNWQRYLMMSGEDHVERVFSEDGDGRREERDWWPEFGQYILKYAQLFAVLAVPYAAFFALFFSYLPQSPQSPPSSETIGSFFMIFGLFFIVMILLYPLMMRAMLVFPAIAAGLPDPTFRNAFNVSRGHGWHMVGAYLLSALAMQLILMGVMIAIMIVVGILTFILPLVGGLLMGLVFLVLYPVMMFSMMAVYTSVPAFSLMQMIPDMNDRWHYFRDREILGEGTGEGGDDDDVGLSPPSAGYGTKKGR